MSIRKLLHITKKCVKINLQKEKDKHKGVFNMLKEFEIALNKAQEVNNMLKKSDQKMVALTDLLDAVEKVSGYDIKVQKYDFSEICSDNPKVKDAGAMLSTITNNNQKSAFIIYNSKQSVQKQRFSIAHELGHLVADVPNARYEIPNDQKFTLSTLINPDITYISEDKCKESNYYMAEQIANIFALLVLIPEAITLKDMSEMDVDSLACDYGVEKEALYSRMLLSTIKE
jgi:Zn-dependent peptidase ImmA (M78 family)